MVMGWLHYFNIRFLNQKVQVSYEGTWIYWSDITSNLSDPYGCVARRSLTALEDRSSIPDAGNNNVLVTK